MNITKDSWWNKRWKPRIILSLIKEIKQVSNIYKCHLLIPIIRNKYIQFLKAIKERKMNITSRLPPAGTSRVLWKIIKGLFLGGSEVTDVDDFQYPSHDLTLKQRFHQNVNHEHRKTKCMPVVAQQHNLCLTLHYNTICARRCITT